MKTENAILVLKKSLIRKTKGLVINRERVRKKTIELNLKIILSRKIDADADDL